MIAKGQSDELMKRIRRQLHAAGYRDLRPIPSHVLLSLRHDQTPVSMPTAHLPCDSATRS